MPVHRIVLKGCDDSTAFDMELTDTELAVVKRIAAASRETSEFGCQPRLGIDPTGDEW